MEQITPDDITALRARVKDASRAVGNAQEYWSECQRRLERAAELLQKRQAELARERRILELAEESRRAATIPG